MSVRVMSWVFDHSTVRHRGDLLVLLVLADHAHEDGTSAFPSVDTIAAKARLTRRGAQLALRRLEAECAIAREEHRGPKGTTSYRVLMTGEVTSQRSHFTGEVSDTGGRTESHEGAKGSSPEPSIEPSEEPSSSSSELDDAAFFHQVFDHWTTTCGHLNAKPTRDRRAKVIARQREGYTLDDIKRAIDGAAVGAFVNDAGKRFDDLELICRNGSKLESFIARASGTTTALSDVDAIILRQRQRNDETRRAAEERARLEQRQEDAA